MFVILFSIGLLCLSIFLFVRQVKLDKMNAIKRDLEGDLHMLTEMKKFMEEHNQDASQMDLAIAEINDQIASL